MECARAFLILGISQCKEEGAIKQAYRKKLQSVNPEDNPEGFRELRAAYEAALEYARSQDEEMMEEDFSPEGRWEERLKQIYNCLPDRLNLDSWKELMEDDLCVALDSGQECRRRLLNFLMEHYRLSTEVWQYLNRVWGFTEQEKELHEEYPDNFAEFLLNVCRDGSWFPLEVFQGPADGDYDLYINLYFELDNALIEENLEQAERLASQMKGLNITHPYGELDFARLFLTRGESEKAKSLTDRACQSLPEDDRVRYVSGLVYWDLKEKDLAAEKFQELLAGNPHNFTANRILGSYWLERGDLDKAKEYTIEAIDGGTVGGNRDPQVMEQLNSINAALIKRYRKKLETDPQDFKNRLKLGWCYLQNDSLHQALALLANQIPDEANAEEYHNFMGKLYYTNEQYEKALVHLNLWKEYLEKREDSWKGTEPEEEERAKNNRRMITVHGLLARIYRLNGENGKPDDFEKALACINKTRELGSSDPAYQMEKANIYKIRAEQVSCREDYQKAVEVLSELIEEDPGYFPAYVMRQNCFTALRDARGVIDDYYQAKSIYAGYPPIYVAAAEVYNDLERWSDLRELLEEAKTNQAYTLPLKIYQCRMERETSEDNKVLEEALHSMEALRAEMDKRKQECPDEEEREFTSQDEARLEAEICITLSLLGQPEQALGAVLRAQKLNETETRYDWIEGNLLRRLRRYEEALKAYEACKKDYDDTGLYDYYVGECYEGLGKRPLAAEAVKKALEKEPDNPDYLRKMADIYQVLLDNTGKMEYFQLGIPYANRRIEINPTTYDYVNRGLMYLTANELEKALEDFLKAGEADKNNQFAWANVACVYKRMGRYEMALHYIQKAVRLMESEPTTYFYETLGRIYTCMGEHEKALEAHLENFRRYPKKYSVAQSLSEAYEKLGRYQEAIDMWRAFFEKDKDAEYYDEVVELCIAKKDFKKAEEAIEKGTPYSGKGKAATRQVLSDINQKKRFFLGMSLEKAVKAYEDRDTADYRTACRMAALYFWMKKKTDKARKYTELYRECIIRAFGSISAEIVEETCTYKRARLFQLAVLSLLEGEKEQARQYRIKMAQCPWCAQCDDAVCKEEQTVNALLAWADGRNEEALSLAREVLKADPSFEEACIVMAVIKGV